VRGCDGRALVAAENKYNGAITVLDAATGKTVSDSSPISRKDKDVFIWCVAASQVGGRKLVATSGGRNTELAVLHSTEILLPVFPECSPWWVCTAPDSIAVTKGSDAYSIHC
jgi:hypothetical protein